MVEKDFPHADFYSATIFVLYGDTHRDNCQEITEATLKNSGYGAMASHST
jgi:hypothetical protein